MNENVVPLIEDWLPAISNTPGQIPKKLDNQNHNHCQQCIHRNICMANKMGVELLADFDQQILHNRPIQKGKHLYWQDAPFKEIYIVHSGAVKAYRVSANGNEQIVGFYYPGDIVGTDGLLNDRHLNSVMTLDVTTVCVLTFANVSELLSKSETFQRCFLSMLSGEVHHEQNHHTFCKKSVDERLAAFLISLSQRNQRSHLSSSTIQLFMRRKDIANYLGLAVETVSRILTRFQERGWIALEGREVTITDRQALERLLAENLDG